MEEALKVTIEDLPDGTSEPVEKSNIRDFDFSLSTGTGNFAITQTEILNCKLDALILYTNKKCDIEITFAEIPEIIVYKNMDFDGTKYIPIRLQAITENNLLLTSGSAKILLNNKLRIKLSGSTDTTLNMTLRCYDG